MRVLLVTLVVLAAGSIYSAVWLDGSIDVVLQGIVVFGAVVLGIEPWVRADRVRVSMIGGALLIVTGTYGGSLAVRGTTPLDEPLVAAAFVVGALLVVVTQKQIRSTVRTGR